jgi:hypothetical protein
MDRRALLPALVGSALGIAAAAAAIAGLPGPRPSAPELPRIEARLVSESLGPLRRVALHFAPPMRSITDAIDRDFLSALPEDVEVLALVPRGGRAELDEFVRTLPNGASLAKRIRCAEVESPVSVWSKDRALVAESGPGQTDLLTPAAPSGDGPLRLADWRSPAQLASLLGAGSRVLSVPLDFDAGDFAVAADRVIVDVNLWSKNRGRYENPEQLRQALERALATKVLLLGRKEAEVPRHHLSMYLTPLDAGVVLVGDPRWGRSLVGPAFAPGEVNPDSGARLVSDDSPQMLERFDRAASELSAAGLEVVRIPTVAFGDTTYFAYTNGVFETRGSEKIAYVPTYGAPALDEAALAVYRSRGWQVRPVSSRAAFPFHGTLGCVINVLARGSAGQ